MALSPFMAALNQICDEKGLPREVVVETVEAALAAAYRKDYGHGRQVVRAVLDEDDITQTKMFQVFTIVKKTEFEDEHSQILLADAKKHQKNIKVGEEILLPLPHQESFGRIAAQTAKQVIIQRLREAERDLLFTEFKEKEGTVVTGSVQQIEANDIIINLSKINAIMLPSGQITGERYYIGQRLKVYVVGVEESSRGPRVLVSRTEGGLIKGLFNNEVPEIGVGTVEIKAVAREAGSRTKMAVVAHQPSLDPVGSCVGQRGVRVQGVLAEIGEEKIDIILWDNDAKKFIANALSPAKVREVEIDDNLHKARVFVPEDQTSLAIGRGGQNVRLASKLTGYSIDIEKNQGAKSNESSSEQTSTEDTSEKVAEVRETTKKTPKKATKKKTTKITAKSTKKK
ncbi:MAG: transcription termination factor NusA [Patescibacteria group bacterium]